jgi:hypothetical protein
MKSVAICTVSSVNYYPFGKTLLQSVTVQHADCDLFYLFVDKDVKDIPIESWFTILSLNELNIPNLEQMAFAYEITELNTAVKPFLFSLLLNKGYKKIIFLDPDIYVYKRLDDVLNVLDTFSIALTPHALHPSQAPKSFLDKVQWEQNMTYTGIFNLGFIGISSTQETMEFLSWWKDRCKYLCLMEPTTGLFVDQKWAELAIVFWEKIFIVRDPGYNVSFWNLHERTIHQNRVNGSIDLVFYHFSSIDIDNESILSKHDKTVGFDTYPELRSLYFEYRRTVNNNGYKKYKNIPYGYSCLADGFVLSTLERRLYSMIAPYCPHPSLLNKKEFYKTLKHYGKNVPQKAIRSIILAKAASGVLKLLGTKKYQKLMEVLGKAPQLRTHTFLLR